mmetsp:Transcript_17819/g.26920  ORF Transcript_17819/g.26920 Transcript_17819/m.26920 type:complete len:286 (+) Transcript_17819:81-938(+)|eukprot:CAMPEP_0194764772 /NCGR_PEP_ID=MMETSP0323_2-20130528/23749_1 /TAXON_ID=2866 ORGANISM="Crypthecodinium cohnii, Strain Seligo" /NCGR_SAMPLE_ID=MMETSP0323_2 /ASSEMBLY_ACC=CAM_ASM_000346 /LENGTH=285 /DNA_ID=CAMNT_0039692695 /DNA_START=54 /DNA_END=911 /DNA_ORIENTATION=-
MSVVQHPWETLKAIEAAPGVVECRLSRAEKRNAMSSKMWDEIREFFGMVAHDGTVRVVLLTGEGSLFCAGVDFEAFTLVPREPDVGHTALRIRSFGCAWQDSFTNLEKCNKVVIACIHNLCLGAAVEMISAADIRFCTKDTVFSLKEVELGMAADVGGLQRFPKLVGNQSLVRELVFSCRNFSASEALPFGFVSKIFDERQAMYDAALEMAKSIAAKSPVAMYSAKHLLNYSRDHTVDESLDYSITWNQAMLQSKDVGKSTMALMKKKPASFPDLPATSSSYAKL